MASLPDPDADADADLLRAPALLAFADLHVEVAPALTVGAVGQGLRRIIPILGGSCRARDWSARVLPGGADFQLVIGERLARLEARYVLETDAGDLIYVHNDALRIAAPELTARLMRGEPVDPSQVYFRCAPRFEAGAASLRWLMERVFVGTGVREPAAVVMRFFELAYLEAEIKQPKKLTAQISLKDFVIPNTELIPEEIRSKVKKWSDYIDYWAVDWDFQSDTFMQGWVAYRTRKERKLPLTSDSHTYEKAGKHRILVKVIDIFGNDTSQAFDVEVK